MDDPRFRTMTENDAAEISGWRYPPPYDFYDPGADEDDLNELLDPVRREAEYSTAVDESGDIIGFAQLTRDGDSVEIGLGLRPDLTGRGLGGDFVEAVVQLARDRHAPRRITLAVAEFNHRAITVYERAGFVAVRRYRTTRTAASGTFWRWSFRPNSRQVLEARGSGTRRVPDPGLSEATDLSSQPETWVRHRSGARPGARRPRTGRVTVQPAHVVDH